MAWTDQNIIDAYNQSVGSGGATEADFVAKAQSMGISNDQLASARNTMMGVSAPAPSPASYTSPTTTAAPAPAFNLSMAAAPAPAPAADRFTDAQYSAARDWASGKTWAEISQKGSDLGLTSAEMGKVFGNFGGSGKQVADMTGYGTGATGFNADGSLKYNTSFAGGKLADGSNPGDWAFDSTKGWVKKAPAARPTGAQGAMDMPTTGINLSNLQNASMWEVKPNQTVQDQLQQIIAADSPLMQQARARALQSANARGLLNSSMAITAGDSALYDAAMPIAQQDASTYADAAKFNTGELNTFSRDNNAFTRDAFMADFNLKANEWAKQQDQYRLYDQLDYTQKQTLERDAIQFGYQGARDAILNGYTVARDDKTNAFTLQRDTNQNTFTSGENQKDRDAAYDRQKLVPTGGSTSTAVETTGMQIAAGTQTAARTGITTARTSFNTAVAALDKVSGMTPDQYIVAYNNLADGYNGMVTGLAADAGWSPESWTVQVKTAPPPAAGGGNVVDTVSGQTGGSGALGSFTAER